MNNYIHSELTDTVIKTFYKVYNNLGFGFLEKVYERAMLYELQKIGLMVKNQAPIKVHYEGVEIGVYFADLLIDDKVIIELKAAHALCDENEAQLVNYLKASEIEVGILLNFGKKPELRRKVFSSSYKPNHKRSQES